MIVTERDQDSHIWKAKPTHCPNHGHDPLLGELIKTHAHLFLARYPIELLKYENLVEET